jgi:hypothetical protein
MSTERDDESYARAVAKALHVLGPTARPEVTEILAAFALDEDRAAAVVAHGLAHAVLAEDARGRLIAGPASEENGAAQGLLLDRERS